MRLRAFTDGDVALVLALSRDPYVPLTGMLPAEATPEQALDWIRRQQARHLTGAGWSFAVADAGTGAALGQAGLWPRERTPGLAGAGYCTDPAARRHGVASAALSALTRFAWTTTPALDHVELLIEPWNVASVRTAERAGYVYDRLLPDHSLPGGRRADVLRYVTARPDS